jgi:hypothetical protein
MVDDMRNKFQKHDDAKRVRRMATAKAVEGREVKRQSQRRAWQTKGVVYSSAGNVLDAQTLAARDEMLAAKKAAQIRHRHLRANTLHHDADLLFGGKLPAAGLLGTTDQLARCLSPALASPALGQGWQSLLTPVLSVLLLLALLLLLLRPQFLFHGSPCFLRILALVRVNPIAQNL